MPLNFDAMRTNMIQGQILPVQRLDSLLRQAVETLPRDKGLPEFLKPLAYCDQELRVFENRFLLSPGAFFKLVSAAHITPKDTVLDCGCTTGYTSAILSYCAKRVVGLEQSAPLCEKARLFLAQQNISNATIVTGDLPSGCPAEAPYDVILIEGALTHVPDALKEQLQEGGRLLFFRQHSPGEVSTGICAHKRGGRLYEEELFHWQASLLCVLNTPLHPSL